MTPSGNGNRLFEIRVSGVVAEAIKQLQRKATAIGLGQQVLANIKALHQRLRHGAADFGEPLFRLPPMELQVRMGVISPLVVIFAVHEVKPLVFLKEIKAMPGHGLD